MIREQIRPAFSIFIMMTLITGVLYPLFMTGIGQVFFKNQAEGSLIYKKGKAIGSKLIGQPFDDPKYFWGRPSATTPSFNGGASSGSNYGPMHSDFLKTVEDRVKMLKASNLSNSTGVPVDLVTASGSGLDPHISLAGAYYQVPRIAHERKMDKAIVRKIIDFISEERQLGFLGEPRVNVLSLNLLLDQWEVNPNMNLEKPKRDLLPENIN